MNKKQIKQTMFALCTAALFTTGCSNDVLTSTGNIGSKEEGTSVLFNLGMPLGDEVDYTRATEGKIDDDASEWAMKSLKVYHFCASVAQTNDEPADDAYTLAGVYDVPVKSGVTLTSGICLNNGNGKYDLKLSLRTNKLGEKDKHAFAFVANDSCATFDAALVAGTTTLEALKKQVADKQVKDGKASASLFMGDPAGLCMTGEVKNKTLKGGVNQLSTTGTPISLTRIMARLDVKNFVPQERNFQLTSVRLLYSGNFTAPKGYLFEATGQDYIWSTTEANMEITQNKLYGTFGYLPVEGYSTDSGMRDVWAAATTTTIKNGAASITRNSVWYKKVLYMYEFPAKTGNDANYVTPLQVEVGYTLNGVASTAIVKVTDENNVNLKIERNTVYILQVGETTAAGGALTFGFAQTPWSIHDIDVDLSEGKETINN